MNDNDWLSDASRLCDKHSLEWFEVYDDDITFELCHLDSDDVIQTFDTQEAMYDFLQLWDDIKTMEQKEIPE